MADIRRLDGTVVDAERPGRDERIAALLAELGALNDEGKLAAVVAVTVLRDTGHGVYWQLPLEDFGFPWGLALRGALVLAQHRIGDADVAVRPANPGPAAS